MNKSKFLELVKNPDLVDEKDLTKLTELTSAHPYCQIGHVLNAKGLKKLDKADFNKALNLAAVYSYDRDILRSIIEGIIVDNKSIQSEPVIEPQELQESSAISSEETPNFEWVNQEPEVEDKLDSSDIMAADLGIDPDQSEIIEDVKDDVTNEKTEVDTTTESDVFESETAAHDAHSEKTGLEQTDLASEKSEEAAGISESSDTLETNRKTSEQTKSEKNSEQNEDSDDSTHSDQDDPVALEIEASGIHAELMKNLNQLQESKQQYQGQPDIHPKDRKEQIEIIDNFIKNSPVLSKPNLSAESEVIRQQDLSKKSAQFSEELASENLAKIYFKQGKKKDAEKIYKRLIRIYPQKKSYFADQIEKLKKK